MGPWNSPGQNNVLGSCFLLQGIFPIQGWNPGLPHCRQILYQLRHQRRDLRVKEILHIHIQLFQYHLLKRLIMLFWGTFILLSLVKFAQSRPTLCDPMDYTVHGILQTRTLEWVVFPFSRGSSQPRDQTQVSDIAGIFFISWVTREVQEY